MSNERVISRRAAIKFAVAAGVAVFVQSQLPGAAVLPRAQQALLPTRLTALLAHPASAKVIGGEYLLHYPQEAAVDTLLDKIAAPIVASEAGLFTTDQQLREQLDGAVRADFAADRIVKLRGWVLSATEARLCALAVLI